MSENNHHSSVCGRSDSKSELSTNKLHHEDSNCDCRQRGVKISRWFTVTNSPDRARVARIHPLRDNVYNIVRYAHRNHYCDFCSKMADLLVFGPNPDGLFLGLFGSNRASNTLQNFVTGIFHLTVKCSSNASQCNCVGQSLVPEFVHAFLFDPTAFTTANMLT
ncbi:hypothetical protein L917_17377 [Phytophthora nicotianae]|uniref:Uncharacterized protein n=1 Tax=Phytophthora nicotianae TaxID=4792 RepID=W2KCZ7_PHYNI|nr:hypothetical protein L917_17377 [Phytophthora nicotianae]